MISLYEFLITWFLDIFYISLVSIPLILILKTLKVVYNSSGDKKTI